MGILYHLQLRHILRVSEDSCVVGISTVLSQVSENDGKLGRLNFVEGQNLVSLMLTLSIAMTIDPV